MKKRATLSIAGLLLLLLVAAGGYFLWKSREGAPPPGPQQRQPGPSPQSAESYAPLLIEIEPADGAVVQGAEAWVRWSASTAAKGRVLWRKAGETDFRTADAAAGDPLLARLTGLKPGETYEYHVETEGEGPTQRSDLRTFSVQDGLALESAAEYTVQRDYDQTVQLTLRNGSDKKVTIAARALAHFDDLPADVVGPGSVDQPVELAPGGKLDLRLAVTAPDATQQSYDIPVEAAGAFVVARVRIAQPKLKLSFRVVAEDPHTLAKTIEVKNEGDPLTGLAVQIAAPSDTEVCLQPSATHALLLTGEAMQFVAAPVLYLEFQSLRTELECQAAGQSASFPLEFKAAAGARLIGVRTGSKYSGKAADWTCPNHPNTCSWVPGLGNGPAKPARGMSAIQRGEDRAGIGGPENDLGRLGLADSLMASIHGLTLPLGYVPRERRPLNLLMVRNNLDEPLVRPAGPPCAQPGGPNAPDDAGKDKPVKPGACGSVQCGSEAYEECYSKPKDYRWQYMALMIQIQGEEESQKFFTAELKRAGSGPAQSPIDDNRPWLKSVIAAHQGRIASLRAQMDELKKLYETLRKKCYDDCGVILPPNLSDETLPFPTDPTEIARHYNASELHEHYLPANFADFTCAEQERKVLASLEAEVDENMETYFTFLARFAELSGNEELAGPLEVVAFTELGLGLQNRRKAMDPPSPDFAQVVQPSIDPLPAPNSATEVERLGWDAVVLSRWKTAYQKAWIDSYERYQGAEAAKDREGMVRQATAMVRFATSGLVASRTESLKRHEFQRSLLAKLQPQMQAGIPWEQMLADYRKTAPADGVPPSLRKTMEAAGIPQDRIAEFGKGSLELTPEKARFLFAQWKREVEGVDRVGEQLRKDRPNVVWPQPDDLALLLGDQQFSRDLLDAAKAGAAQPAAPQDADAGNGASILTWRQLRPGLLEALQRRASFTRAHRGAFAAALDGDEADSSDTASEWHAGDRVCFAWHQEKDQIAFVAFDPHGEVLLAPQVIGKGRWPRVAADGGRTAVAWGRDDGFVVRLHDGKQWGDEIVLPGREAAITFVPGGPLYAVTSTGLWKLTDKQFERIQEATYSQPALAIDGQGKPHAAWRRDGKIVVDDAAVDEGERPALVIGPDGTMHLAYLSRGALVLRSRKGETWTAPETVQAKKPSWPALAWAEDGVRLTYLGAAERGPDALWLVRPPAREPVLVPSLAGNVTEAALLLQFGLREPRWWYRPYDAWVSVNDVVVATFDNAIPEGRYLYPLNPYQVFTATGRPAPNRLAIHSWHMNVGHYATSNHYQLIVRTAWSDQYAFAADEDEVRRIVQPEVNHDRPDLAVLANGLKLPVKPPESGRTDFAVAVANLGEGDSRPARLVMLSGDKELAQAAVPPLKPGEQVPVTMQLQGRAWYVTFKLEQEQPDFDPANDSLTLHLWNDHDLEPGKNPTASVLQSPLADLDLRKWKAQGPNGAWEASADGKSVVQKENGNPTFYVGPDSYADATIKGKLKVEDLSDDDYIGFVFGYQSPLAEKGDKDNQFEFLLFDWKKADQGPAKEGFALVRVKGNFDEKAPDGEYAGFWDRKSSPRFEVLATDLGAGKGWKANTEHAFELHYEKDRVRIAVDGKAVFDVKGDFPPGRFGFFNYSQAYVRYSGFNARVGAAPAETAAPDLKAGGSKEAR